MIFLDFETRSTANLKNLGAWKYALNPRTEIILLSYCTETSKIKTISLLQDHTVPERLEKAITNEEKFIAHNARFEILIWRFICAARFGWPEIPLNNWIDTMALASQYNLPRGLDDCAKALGIGEKDEIGHKLMLKMCKPRKQSKHNKNLYFHDDVMERRLIDYCEKDVEITRKIFQALPWKNENELELWRINQEMNDTGLKIDKRSVVNSLKIIAKEEKKAKTRLLKLSRGKIKTPNQCKVIAKYCGVKSIAKIELDKAIESATGRKKKILTIRRNMAKSSTKKLKSILQRLDTDRRMRDLTLYHGASTGRETGTGPQPLNFPRGELKFPETLKAIKRIRRGKKIKTPLQTISNCLRGFIIADKGKEFICADYAGIEARLVFWLAGEEKALNAFRRDKDIYVKQACSIYEKKPSKITKDERYIGKQTILGLGYGMGHKKFVVNCFTKSDGKVKITEAFAKRVVDLYRADYPKIGNLWRGIERAAVTATLTKKEHTFNGIKYRIRDNTLVCRLLSGRELVYQRPEITQGKFNSNQIAYYGTDSQAKRSMRWGKIRTYGGALVENIIQATARDILTGAVLRLRANGFNVVLTIYDEILIDQNKNDVSENTLKDVIDIMTMLPDWAEGLPLKAEGWIGKRYRKG